MDEDDRSEEIGGIEVVETGIPVRGGTGVYPQSDSHF